MIGSNNHLMVILLHSRYAFSPVLEVQSYSWDKDSLFCNLGAAFVMTDYLFYSNQTGLIVLKPSKHSS